MEHYYSETKDQVNKVLMLNLFATYFARQFKDQDGEITVKDVGDFAALEIVCQGNTLPCIKLFVKLNCMLCMKERVEIMKVLVDEPKN